MNANRTCIKEDQDIIISNVLYVDDYLILRKDLLEHLITHLFHNLILI